MPRPRSASHVLALDIGSSSVRSALFDHRGIRQPETTASRKYSIRYSADGAAELDPAVLLRSTRACVMETLRAPAASSSLQRGEIVAVSGSAFWHGLLGLDRAEHPVTPVFTWADSRSKADAIALRHELDERQMQLRTGCMLRAQFWPAKLRWLRRVERTLFRRVTRWASPACWIFRELFGVDVASRSMASGTGLYNLKDRSWDLELCGIVAVRPEQLDSLDERGSVETGPAQLRNAEIFAALGDGAASNLGSGADHDGVIAINLGTSGAVRTVVPHQMRRSFAPGLFRYVVDDQRDVIGGAISNAGNLHQWCLRELRISAAAAERALSRRAAADDLLTVLPFWVDERAPTWPETVRGTIIGLAQTTTAADILRASATSSFYRLAEIFERLQSSSTSSRQIVVSGGILRSRASLRILADCIGHDIHICPEQESSLRGAALLALRKLGMKPAPLQLGAVVRCDRNLVAEHGERRAQQQKLERLLERSA